MTSNPQNLPVDLCRISISQVKLAVDPHNSTLSVSGLTSTGGANTSAFAMPAGRPIEIIAVTPHHLIGLSLRITEMPSMTSILFAQESRL
jgi:hypothetical protein